VNDFIGERNIAGIYYNYTLIPQKDPKRTTPPKHKDTAQFASINKHLKNLIVNKHPQPPSKCSNTPKHEKKPSINPQPLLYEPIYSSKHNYSLSIVQEFTVLEFEGLESKAGYICSAIPNT
jgi:hypothetical protein